MSCKPPSDEYYKNGLKGIAKKKDKWRKDAAREIRQHGVISLIRDQPVRPWKCLLIRPSDRLEDVAIVQDLKQWSFLLKGLTRCLMVQNGADNLKIWRRLFGVNKKHWINLDKKNEYDHELHIVPEGCSNWLRELFEQWKTLTPKNQDKKDLPPTSWRSQVHFTAFKDNSSAKNHIADCPMKSWADQDDPLVESTCPLVRYLSKAINDGNDGRLALMQVHDPLLPDGANFSELLKQTFTYEGSPHSFLGMAECVNVSKYAKTLPHSSQDKSLAGSLDHRANCIDNSGLGGPATNRLISQIVICWGMNPSGPVISGLSVNFAKFFTPDMLQDDPRFKGRAKGWSPSLYLSSPEDPSELTPALLTSSIKGVWRMSMGWLFETLALGQGTTKPCTSDYWNADKKNGDWPGERTCPLRLIFGGSLAKREGEKDRSKKGIITFQAFHGSYIPGEKLQSDWNAEQEYNTQFPYAFSKKDTRYLKGLRIEAIETWNSGDYSLKTVINSGPHSKMALIALCLSADLMSAGFFRIGRFTTRGFGAVRMKPESVDERSLIDFLDEKDTGQTCGPWGTGMDLLKNHFKIEDPLGELVSWLKSLSPENYKEPAEEDQCLTQD